ncbi:MAG: D-2-hydroxyacid dehydrogenase [Luteolibacter sp.]
MIALKIFSDSPLSPPDKQLLLDGAAPHEILFPEKAVSSVLGAPEPDPSFHLADIAFGQPDLESIARSERLKWIHISSAGFTRYDTPAFRALVAERCLIVTNSSSVYAEACADHVFAFMLAHSRRLPQALRSHAPNASPEWFQLRGDSVSLRGQSAVILGFGAIATMLLKLLAPYEMKITAMRRSPHGNEGIPTVTPDELPATLATADHVINILPDNPASRNFINAACIAHMKPGVVIHNIGRGTTIDQADLLAALRSSHVGAAWLDVTDPEPLPTDHPLRGEPNCFITPHIAGGHRGESQTLIRHFLKNLRCFNEGTPLGDRIM